MKAKTSLLLFLASGLMLLYSGCEIDGPCIHGNDMVITETRIIGSFTAISSESFFDVFIVQDSTEEVIVEAESNLMPYIQTWVSGTTLVLREQENHCLKNNFPIRVTVKVKDLSRVYLTGSGNIQGNSEFEANSFKVELTGSGVIDLEVNAQSVETYISGSGKIDLGAVAHHITAKISGSGDINLWGEAVETDLEITGSGNIKAFGLLQNSCAVSISGSGNVYVYVDDYLDVRITGSGSVFYKGSPQIVTTITGSGSIVHQ